MTPDGTAAPPSADGAAVRTLELTKHYGASVALSGLTMVVPRGEVFGFLGPNGSGKTTAVKLLLGLSRPTGGEAWVLGRPAGDRQTRSRVGYLPELFRYQGWLSAAEVLGLHCRLAGISRSEWPAQISGALSTVGLTGHADAKVETFSKGMQQRLGLGVALLGNPELVILDEPTSALDPVGRADTRTIIRRLRDRGCAVFLNSHLLGEVEQICDRAAVVADGHVLAIGRLDELLGSGGVRMRLTGLTDVGRASLARRGTLAEHEGWFVVNGVDADAVPDLVADAGREWRQGLCRRTGPPDARGAVPLAGRGRTGAMAALTIARLTIREAARRKLLLALAILTVVVIGLTGWGFQHLSTLTNPDGSQIPADELRLAVSQVLVFVEFMFSARARAECCGRGVSGDLQRVRVGCRPVDARSPREQVSGRAWKVARAWPGSSPSTL